MENILQLFLEMGFLIDSNQIGNKYFCLKVNLLPILINIILFYNFLEDGRGHKISVEVIYTKKIIYDYNKMPRPVVPVECKEIRTMKVNITQTTQEELKTHLDNLFVKYCKEADEIKRKQNELIDYVYHEAYKNFCWREKKPRRIKWDEWMNGNEGYYSKIIMEHFDYRHDLRLYLKAFNTDPDFDIDFDETLYEITNKYTYDYDIPEEFKLYEQIRYKESEAEWKIRDADWIAEKEAKSSCWNNHKTIERQISDYEGIIKQIKYLQAQEFVSGFLKYEQEKLESLFPNGIKNLVDLSNSECKYCIALKEQNLISEQRRKEREAKQEAEEQRRIKAEEEWLKQKELEKETREAYECELCHYKTYNDAEYEKHEESKEHKKMEELRKYYCSDCDIQTRNQMELNIHKQTMKHKIRIGEIEKQTDFKCEVCNYETKLKQNWEKHILTKTHIYNSQK